MASDGTPLTQADIRKGIGQVALACAMHNDVLRRVLDGESIEKIKEEVGEGFMDHLRKTTERMLELCEKMVPGDE